VRGTFLIIAFAGCASAMNGEPTGLVVTEIAAAGAPDDWVEVMNTSDEPLDLDDFVVVDARDDLDRARPLGAVTLAPGERHVRVLTDATVGFRLAGDEELWVYRAGDGALVDGVDWRQGASPPGGSFAREGDVGAFVTVTTDTRGHANWK
jgi:hypothetical protein